MPVIMPSDNGNNNTDAGYFDSFEVFPNGTLDRALSSAPLSGSMYALGENSSSFSDGTTSKFILKEEPQEKPRLGCRYAVVVFFLVFFVLVSIVMTGLFIWKITCSEGYQQHSPEQSAKTNPPPRGCSFKPAPVAFRTIPAQILDNIKQLEEFIEAEVAKGQATAVSVSIVYSDRVLLERGYGVMNKSDDSRTPPTSKTLYPCASITKIVTALALFKLYNDGHIPMLDAPITEYESGFSIQNSFHRNITLRDLANQRAGLQREAPCYPASDSNLCPYNYSIMLQRIKKLTLLRKPGTEPQYSNLGWSILGQILAKQFGKGNFKSWMKNYLFTSLGMNSSSFTLTKRQISEIPVGYTSSTSYHDIMDWGWLAPSGGLYSSVHDLAQMEMKVFSDEFIASWAKEEFFKEDYIFPDGKTMIGKPWEMRFYKGWKIRDKTGYIYGYNSYVAIVPELKIAFNSICTNCNSLLDVSLKRYFHKIVSTFDEELEKASAKNYRLPPDPRRYIGIYGADNIPIITQMEVRRNSDDKLAIAINGADYDIFFINYTNPQTFQLHLNPSSACNELFTMGVEGSSVIFDSPSLIDGLSRGFTMYNAHPSGESYFTRKAKNSRTQV